MKPTSIKKHFSDHATGAEPLPPRTSPVAPPMARDFKDVCTYRICAHAGIASGELWPYPSPGKPPVREPGHSSLPPERGAGGAPTGLALLLRTGLCARPRGVVSDIQEGKEEVAVYADSSVARVEGGPKQCVSADARSWRWEEPRKECRQDAN